LGGGVTGGRFAVAFVFALLVFELLFVLAALGSLSSVGLLLFAVVAFGLMAKK
jgi:hypothetical protein